MEIMAKRVDWEEAVRRHHDGTLHAAIIEALDNEEAWVERHDLPTDSFRLTGDLAAAYEQMRPSLSSDARELAHPLLGVLFGSWYEVLNANDIPNDLGEEPSPESFYASLSPERVLSLANASRRFPDAQLNRAAHACPQDVWEDFSYEDDFVAFVDQLRGLVERAAKDGARNPHNCRVRIRSKGGSAPPRARHDSDSASSRRRITLQTMRLIDPSWNRAFSWKSQGNSPW